MSTHGEWCDQCKGRGWVPKELHLEDIVEEFNANIHQRHDGMWVSWIIDPIETEEGTTVMVSALKIVVRVLQAEVRT